MNRFARALCSGKTIVAATWMPPTGSDEGDFRALLSALPPGLDAVIVADNPDRIRGSAFSLAAMLRKETQASIILSMAMRDRNRIALISDALGAAALDIDAILCVSGNHQSIGICPEAAAANDVDSVQFVQAMKKLVLYGSGPNGKEVKPELKLQIGATAHPYLLPMELNLLRLKKKIAVGADFLITQAVFDLDGFNTWMDAVRSIGLDNRTAIIPSVLPLTSVEKAKKLQQNRIYGPIGDDVIAQIANAKDPVKKGLSIASETAMQLRKIPGVRGINILSGGCESLTADVIRQAGI
jgi:methylenetetrahydrofolate reductase (NADPH)